MIPDGTSLSTISAARWQQWYSDPSNPSLNIDPYICGTVLTFSSNAPIGDSAPTTSCYMTGIPSRAGYVSTYPLADPLNDIYPTNPSLAYQPLMTILEAGRIEKGMSTGLVATCEFTHATPADCAAHTYDRGRYDWISEQMVSNQLDVVLAGGTSILTQKQSEYLQARDYGVFKDDINGFRNYTGNKMWSLFEARDMPYDLDRDHAKIPSIAEMTKKAIEKLSTNPNGFFLMVEGSKIDWAAHDNDITGMLTDFLAFDKACGEAIEFAKENKETIVLILSDHGNSGMSIGSHKNPSYSKATKDDLFKAVAGYKKTAKGLSEIVKAAPQEEMKELLLKYANINLSDKELESLVQDHKLEDSGPLRKNLTALMNNKTNYGFTTNGHTGEEVILAAYHPHNKEPRGFLRNFEINAYMADALGLNKELDNLTQHYFHKHTAVFEGMQFQAVDSKVANELPFLRVKYKKNNLELYPNSNVCLLNKKYIDLSSVVIYMDKNETFYLPLDLREMMMR